jgi:polyribonucleotide nucleotidyltransferase
MLAGVKEFEGPVAGVRIASDESGNFIFDPTFVEIEAAHLDLTVAGTMDAITMVESQGQEVSNDLMVRAFEYAHEIIKTLCNAQIDFVSEYVKVHALPETVLTIVDTDPEVIAKVKDIVTESEIKSLYNLGKLEFHDAMHDLVESVKMKMEEEWLRAPLSGGLVPEAFPYKMSDIADSVKKVISEHMRKTVIETGTRLDGRKSNQVRPVRATSAILPRTHGSALFERGVTQVLSIATLGGPSDIQLIDDMFEEDTKRYIHHYNFPPFSVGEVKPLRGVGRREVGHGRLAEKALEPVLPNQTDFPYMMRVVSETTTCNGSSSMASVCGSTMALMDAGVPIRAMVA